MPSLPPQIRSFMRKYHLGTSWPTFLAWFVYMPAINIWFFWAMMHEKPNGAVPVWLPGLGAFGIDIVTFMAFYFITSFGSVIGATIYEGNDNLQIAHESHCATCGK